MDTPKEMDKIISLKEKELNDLRFKRQKMLEQNLTPAQELAIFLHKKMCHHDHTEYCDWYYDVKNGVHDWTSRGEYGAHAEYLKKAKKVIAAGFKPEDIERLLKIL